MKHGLLRPRGRKAAAAVGGVMAIGMSLFGFNASPSSAASRQTTGHSWVHCPWGDVCVYPENKDPFSSNVYPESNGKYYTYGFHKVYNQYGLHYIVDNQTIGSTPGKHGDDELTSCSGNFRIEGHHTSGYPPPESASWVEMTPVNCISLY